MIGKRKPVVAIDGPAGAGKSTIAAQLARRLGFLNIETGAIYRALALAALNSGVPLEDGPALRTLANRVTIELLPGGESNRVLLNGREVSARLRERDVTEAASRVSVHPEVRERLLSVQRALGAKGGVVMEGRDIGTVVFPDADVKIFLDASPDVRAERRLRQQGAAEASEVPEAMIVEMQERDRRDSSRNVSPLVPAPEAVLIDSSALTLDDVVCRIEALVRERLAGEGSASPA